MERNAARSREKQAQRQEAALAELAEARRFLVEQKALFAEIGVTVQAQYDWGVKFQVGDTLVIDLGNAVFARVLKRVLERGGETHASVVELVQDHYPVLQLTARGTTQGQVQKQEQEAGAAQEGSATAILGVSTGAVQSKPVTVTQEQEQEAGAAQAVPETAILGVSTGAVQEAPATVTKKETRKQRARRVKRENKEKDPPSMGVEPSAQVDAQVPANEAEMRVKFYEREIARAAAELAAAQAQGPPNVGVDSAAQVGAQVRESEAELPATQEAGTAENGPVTAIQ
jgi:hypothetical protein